MRAAYPDLQRHACKPDPTRAGERGTDRRVSPGSTRVPLTVFLPKRKRKQQEKVRAAGEALGGPAEAGHTVAGMNVIQTLSLPLLKASD